jgi:hypothetical protein
MTTLGFTYLILSHTVCHIWERLEFEQGVWCTFVSSNSETELSDPKGVFREAWQ